MSNPVLLHLPLRNDLVGRDQAGVVTATANGPVRFTADGYYAEEGTTNLIPNPSAEVNNSSGWSAEQLATRDTSRAWVGTASYRKDAPAAMENLTGYRSDTLTATAHTFSAYVYHTAAIAKNFHWRYNGVDSATTLVPPNTWTRVMATFTGTGGMTTFAIRNAEAFSVGQSVWVDGLQLEQKAYATSYCDGSLGTGYSWAGTAHASASTRAAARLSIDETARIAAAAGSIALRLKRKTDTGANQTLIDVGDGTAGKDRLTVRVSSSDQAQMAWASNGAAATSVSDPDPIATVDTSRMIYAEWTGTATGISIDNTTLVTGVRDAAQGDLSSANDLLIGALAGGSAYADSQISDVLIFDRPLSDAERNLLAATPEWSFGVLQPRIGGALRISNGIGLAISSVAAPAAIAIARAAGGLS